MPTADATVVTRLHQAGAVLIAKLSLGALALNDIWFGGQTMNPWLLEEGASGSSAGPGAATAAGLVGFSIGSETGGSIVAPAMRCGVTGLRPTFGRVPRTGAMTLCWSLDKLGPMTRSVEDAMLVLRAITGPDAGDVSSVPSHLEFDGTAPAQGVRVGYFPAWMKENPATDVDRAALETVRKVGMVPTEVSLPDWPYGSLMPVLFSEAAAAFEELTLAGGLSTLKEQVPDAWPNLFRQARFLSAVDFVQADRFRRRVATEMDRVFSQVDVLLVPSLRDEMFTISTSRAIRRSPSARVSSPSPRHAAIGRPTRTTRCRDSRRRGGCPTASPSSGDCSTKAPWLAPVSRSSGRSAWSRSGRRDSEEEAYVMILLSLVIALALQAQSTPPEPRRVTPDGPPVVKPIYRELKPGEERVEGLLQRVECPSGRPVTFVVKLKDRAAKYQAPRLDAVEYIAYTPDFKGPMSCGGRGQGDRVYLTWKTVEQRHGLSRLSSCHEAMPTSERPTAGSTVARSSEGGLIILWRQG